MANEHRPDPDALLKQVQQEGPERTQGKLKIFFGAAPGVGKTYAMLEAGHRLQQEGIDVLVGHVDTHGRKETEALVQGLRVLPPRWVIHRNTKLREFDLDAALERHPAVILVDELAHTNASDARHPKRWQDVMELLEAGIDVYTTLNVQHIESLNDVVAQITYVRVRETIPDAVLERANEIELIDLPPDELLNRLREGKVYIPEQAQQALQHFFRKGNLLALRELALRSTAQRVDVDVQAYRKAHGIETTWHATERILVCVTPNPMAERLIRAGKRISTHFQAPWVVLRVESPQQKQLSERQQSQLQQNLQLAESLGAEIAIVHRSLVSEGILEYARIHNITKILVGKPMRSRWLELLFGSVVDSVIRGSGNIDIFVITEQATQELPESRPLQPPKIQKAWPYVAACLGVALATGLGLLVSRRYQMAEAVMVYLLSILGVAIRYGRGPSVLASVLSVGLLDFFFVEPYYSLQFHDPKYLFTFLTLLVVGLVVSQLTYRVGWQVQSARKREQHTAVLYRMSQKLSLAQNKRQLAEWAAMHLADLFHARLVVGVAASPKIPTEPASVSVTGLEWMVPFAEETWETRERGIAEWVFFHGKPAGLGTDTLPASRALYLPLLVAGECIGVLGVLPERKEGFQEVETRRLLQALCDQIALGLERCLLLDTSQQAALRNEKDQLRSTLLRAVSHDLRTPLTVMTAAASNLLSRADFPATPSQRELLQTIVQEGEHLHRLIRNLLDMTRLESGGVSLQKTWLPIEEVVGSALHHVEKWLDQHPVQLDIPQSAVLVPMDGGLIEQVLVNLLENAMKHTPPGTPIEIHSRASRDLVNFVVADRGPGLPLGKETEVFEPFVRGQSRADGGVGLGLAICKGIVEAHGGTIGAMNRRGGGASFYFTLPIYGTPPSMPEANTTSPGVTS